MFNWQPWSFQECSIMEKTTTSSFADNIAKLLKYDATAVCSTCPICPSCPISYQRKHDWPWAMVSKQKLLCGQYYRWHTLKTRCQMETVSLLTARTVCLCGAGNAFSASRDLLHDVAIVPLYSLVNATDTRSKEAEINHVQSSLGQQVIKLYTSKFNFLHYKAVHFSAYLH